MNFEMSNPGKHCIRVSEIPNSPKYIEMLMHIPSSHEGSPFLGVKVRVDTRQEPNPKEYIHLNLIGNEWNRNHLIESAQNLEGLSSQPLSSIVTEPGDTYETVFYRDGKHKKTEEKLCCVKITDSFDSHVGSFLTLDGLDRPGLANLISHNPGAAKVVIDTVKELAQVARTATPGTLMDRLSALGQKFDKQSQAIKAAPNSEVMGGLFSLGGGLVKPKQAPLLA